MPTRPYIILALFALLVCLVLYAFSGCTFINTASDVMDIIVPDPPEPLPDEPICNRDVMVARGEWKGMVCRAYRDKEGVIYYKWSKEPQGKETQ